MERASDLVFVGADDRIRTGDPHLGKVMLYQLSHVRTGCCTIAIPQRPSDSEPRSRVFVLHSRMPWVKATTRSRAITVLATFLP